MDKNKALHILDRFEEIRFNAKKKPGDYPPEYTIRLLEAIVATEFGFKGRLEWIKALESDPSSSYSLFFKEK